MRSFTYHECPQNVVYTRGMSFLREQFEIRTNHERPNSFLNVVTYMHNVIIVTHLKCLCIKQLSNIHLNDLKFNKTDVHCNAVYSIIILSCFKGIFLDSI